MIESTINWIAKALGGQPEAFAARSPKWAAVRDNFLRKQPFCAVCGYRKNLNVHHIFPFHIFPELELDPKNLITLGESCPGGNHHLYLGHLGNWESYNELIVVQAKQLLVAYRSRPVIEYPY